MSELGVIVLIVSLLISWFVFILYMIYWSFVESDELFYKVMFTFLFIISLLFIWAGT